MMIQSRSLTLFISQVQQKYSRFSQELMDCLIAVYRKHFSLLMDLTDNYDNICPFLSLEDLMNMLSTDKGKKTFAGCIPFLSRQLASLKPSIESIFDCLEKIATNPELEIRFPFAQDYHSQLSKEQRQIAIKCILDLGRIPLTIQMINDILNIGFDKTDYINIMYTIHFIIYEIGSNWEYAREFHEQMIEQLIPEISPFSDLLIELLFFRKQKVLDQKDKTLHIGGPFLTYDIEIFKHYCKIHGPLKAFRMFIDNDNNIEHRLTKIIILILKYCHVHHPETIRPILQIIEEKYGKEYLINIAQAYPDISRIMKET